MEIVRKVVYEVNGKQYNSRKEAVKAAENSAYDHFRNLAIKHGLEMKKFNAFYEDIFFHRETTIERLTIDYFGDDEDD